MYRLNAQSTRLYPADITSGLRLQTEPTGVRDLYADVGSTEKVFIDLACSSHNAMWERNHLLFRASLEWLTLGTGNGTKSGMLKLGYDAPRATQ
jgi:hypothetical protein